MADEGNGPANSTEHGQADDGAGDQTAAIAARLKDFLGANPLARLLDLVHPGGQRSVVIARPWGDRSVLLQVSEDQGLVDALNSLLLPARYSGVWHKDTKDFEILWTAFKPPPRAAEVVGRSFKFKFRNKEYDCEFTRSSERVLAIAKSFLPAGPTDTDYRNLWSYETLVTGKPEMMADQVGEPLSFWIRKLEWQEDEVFALITHLNFYLTYFDGSSPYIRVHSPPTEEKSNRPTRYPAGQFPKNIAATEIDPAILFLWEAALTGDPPQRFLYYYRIVEYASAVYLDVSARSALRVALALPNALDDLSAVTESVVAAVQKMKMDEYARYETMMREIIDPQLLWRELSLNVAAFTADTTFDGGFKVSALFGAGRTAADYGVNDVNTFAKAIRDIRNALSHGRDQRTGTTITPTSQNASRLVPWLGPMRLVASQVMLYKNAF